MSEKCRGTSCRFYSCKRQVKVLIVILSHKKFYPLFKNKLKKSVDNSVLL